MLGPYQFMPPFIFTFHAVLFLCKLFQINFEVIKLHDFCQIFNTDFFQPGL